MDRIGKVASGLAGALHAPVGLVYDLARAPFVDEDELDGFVNVLYGRTVNRGGELFGNLLGPEEGVGAAIGGLPEAVRQPIRSVSDPALRGLEYAGREFVREPLTAALTAGSLMQAGEGFDIGRGYEIAQTRSLGQAFALAILTEDITDEAEIADAMGTDWYQALSGTMDAVSRIFLEPDVLISGGLTSARRAGAAARTIQALAKVPGAAGLVEAGVFGRTIRTAKDVEAALAHPALGVINERIGRIKAEAGLNRVDLPDLPEPVPVDETLRVRRAEVESRLGAAEAPAAPGITRTLETAPPAAPGMPALFHGTAKPIPGGQLDDTLTFDAQAGNLFGSGFYTTASEEMASKYQKKEAKRAAPTDEPTVYSVEWSGDRPPNVLDLDETIQPELVEIIRRNFGEQSYVMRFLADEDVATLNQMMDEGASTADVYRKFKEALADSGELLRSEADEIITDLNWAIRDELGVDVFKHRGGVYAFKGKGPEHDVYIWLDPTKMRVTEASRGPSREAMQTYETAVARHGALSDEAAEARKAVEAEEARFEKETRRHQAEREQAQREIDRQREVAVDRAAARIRDLAFHDHRDGAIISRVLAEADDLPTAWGALMGHAPSVKRMWAERADVMGEISRLEGDQARVAQMERLVGALGPDQLPLELPNEIRAIDRAQADAELNALYDTESRLAYHEQAIAMVREIPRISATSERRARMVRSDFFQGGPDQSRAARVLAKPLRVAVNMRPRNLVDLHDAAGDAQVTRLLRKARLPIEEQDALRGAYMAAADPTARNAALARVEGRVIRALAEKHDITDPVKIDKLVEQAGRGRAATMGKLMQSRRYDGKGRSYIWEKDPDTGVEHKIYLPLSVTQEVNHFILPDLDQLEKVFARHGDEISRPGAALETLTEAMESYQRIWKPSVLLRVGWPLRVVGEEQLRIMSQIGALTTMGRSAVRLGQWVGAAGVDAVQTATQAARRIPRSERAYRGGLTREQRVAQRGIRPGMMNIRGAEIESAFGTNEAFNDVYRTLNSARSSFEHVVRNADDIRNGLRTEVLGEWQSLEPTMRGYAEAWEHAVNKQIGQDELWRQFVEGKSIDEVRDWLDNTTQGRTYKKRVRHWRGREDDWLEFMAQTVDDYLPTDDLRRLALEGKAKTGDLERAIPDAGGRPVVHGAALADVHAGTRYAQALGKMRDRAMQALGGMPTDVLSRNNYFDHVYTTEVTRLIDLAADQGLDLTPDLIKQFEGKARNHALGKSKTLLYDLADESELSHIFRFISPFYSAWQEVMTRWTGIAIDNPAFVARLHDVWRSPERMGIVTDENGATVNEDGTATIRIGDRDEIVEAGEDRYVNFRLLAGDNAAGKILFNDLTRSVPGVKRLETAKFNKKSANIIVQGAPGVGPIVQIPVNEIAKGRPELEDSVRWALPFGATQSTLDMVLPATLRRMKTKAGGEEDRIYRNQLMRIYWDMQVDYNLDKRADAPTYGEAKKKTDAFYNVRTLASFVSPVAPSFQSPYQPYIDAYRALKEKDQDQDRNAPGYRSPDEIFLEAYGEEFFPLTQSLSKTMDGIPPTLEGYAARQKYVDMIEKHPELGQLIVGAEGSGEFSSAVYQSQLQQPLAPGSADKQRQAFSFEDAEAKPNERRGWMEFSKAMDIIDAERMNRGLPNLQVKPAQDLRDLKNDVIRSLEKKYPEWAVEFNITDRGRWGRRIAGMREIAADERLSGRPEIQMLGQYLETRDQVIDILAARKAAGGASTLNSTANMDLKGVWDQITGQMTQNPAFASVFYRWLERDPLDIDTGRSEIAALEA